MVIVCNATAQPIALQYLPFSYFYYISYINLVISVALAELILLRSVILELACTFYMTTSTTNQQKLCYSERPFHQSLSQ